MRTAFIASFTALLLAACASSKAEQSGPPPIEVNATGKPGEASAARSYRMTASVQAVDAAGRRLTLKEEDGKIETISVPPGVKRFDEISAGDTIEVEVQEGVLFEYQPPGSPFVAPAAVVAGAKAGAGQPPGAAVGAAIQSTVTVTAIDLNTRIVQFQDPDGDKYQVKAGPKLAIEKLSVGDRLLATYVATVAVALDKKP
jgi:hypothetical protein